MSDNHKPVRQPRRLTCGRVKYTLVTPWKETPEGFSEGPFYRAKGQKHDGWLFTPDADFLHKKTPAREPEFMHRIQVEGNEKLMEMNGGTLTVPVDFVPAPPPPPEPAQKGDEFA